MATVITVGGVDITDDVRFGSTEFISAVNGQPSSCKIVLNDRPATRSFVLGSRILLTVDGLNVWAGYLMRTRRNYPFKTHSPSGFRQFELIGLDINILFSKRIVFNQSDPTLAGPLYPADTSDLTVFSDLFADYLDLSGDDIDTTTLVSNVGNVNTGQKTAPIWCSKPWGETMRQTASYLAPVWYINPDRKLVWSDVDVEDAPYDLSDNPGVGQIGVQRLNISYDATAMVNDIISIGVGQGGDDTGFPSHRRTSDASVTEHGLWQDGGQVAGIYKQTTIEKYTNSVINGSPLNKRGHKDDRVIITALVHQNGLRAGMKCRVVSEVWGYDDVIPIRQMRVTWFSPDQPKYDLILTHDYDVLSFFDPYKIPVVNPEITITDPPPVPKCPDGSLPPCPGGGGCDDTVCGITDTFTRTVAGGWGTSDSGLAWYASTPSYTSASVSDGLGHLQSGPGPAASNPDVYAQIEGFPFDGNLDMLMRFRFKIADDANAADNPILRMVWGGWGNFYDIYVYPTAAIDKLYLETYPITDTIVASPLPFGDSGWMWLRWEAVVGSQQRVKFWADGAAEPETWTATQSLVGAAAFDPDDNTFQILVDNFGAEGRPAPQVDLWIDSLEINGFNRCGAVQFDDFNRTVASGGWGTSDWGLPWLTSGNYETAGMSVNGSAAVVAAAANDWEHAEAYMHSTGAGAAPWSMAASYTLRARLQLPVNAAVDMFPFTIVNGGFDKYGAKLLITRESGTDVSVQLTTDDGYNSDAAGPIPTTLGWFNVAWEVTPGVSSSVKVWADGSAEPSAWLISLTDLNGPTFMSGDSEFILDMSISSGAARSLLIDSIDFDYDGKPCYPGQGITDSFTRVVSGGWGTSDQGTAWDVGQYNDSIRLVDGSSGVIKVGYSESWEVLSNGWLGLGYPLELPPFAAGANTASVRFYIGDMVDNPDPDVPDEHNTYDGYYTVSIEGADGPGYSNYVGAVFSLQWEDWYDPGGNRNTDITYDYAWWTLSGGDSFSWGYRYTTPPGIGETIPQDNSFWADHWFTINWTFSETSGIDFSLTRDGDTAPVITRHDDWPVGDTIPTTGGSYVTTDVSLHSGLNWPNNWVSYKVDDLDLSWAPAPVVSATESTAVVVPGARYNQWFLGGSATFTLSYPCVAGSHVVYVSGVRITGATEADGIVTLPFAPASTESVLISYLIGGVG